MCIPKFVITYEDRYEMKASVSSVYFLKCNDNKNSKIYLSEILLSDFSLP